MNAAAQKYPWDDLSDEELLDFRIRDLKLQMENSPLSLCIEQLYEELDSRGIVFQPPCFLGDEWFCPDKEPIISIPFCLAHERLKELEIKMMYEVEGGTHESCMKLLRHECGHAINYAYQLYRRTRWRELFGYFSEHYSDSYAYKPYSKRFVVHLEDNYAQSHPDEDFAETFAVWLNPKTNWREKYKNWPVLKKLNYVDNVMRKIQGQPPKITASGNRPFAAARMTSTLRAYYERKRKMLGNDWQGYYDDSLKIIFSQMKSRNKNRRASHLIRKHRRELINHITRWTGHRKYDIDQLIIRFIKRCDALELTTKKNSLMGITTLLTAIAGSTLKIQRRR